jgi:hypothetical protein
MFISPDFVVDGCNDNMQMSKICQKSGEINMTYLTRMLSLHPSTTKSGEINMTYITRMLSLHPSTTKSGEE